MNSASTATALMLLLTAMLSQTTGELLQYTVKITKLTLYIIILTVEIQVALMVSCEMTNFLTSVMSKYTSTTNGGQCADENKTLLGGIYMLPMLLVSNWAILIKVGCTLLHV